MKRRPNPTQIQGKHTLLLISGDEMSKSNKNRQNFHDWIICHHEPFHTKIKR